VADSGLSDQELVARAKDGNRDAFGQLAERYYKMVSILAYQKTKNRADAEDVVQESFVRAYKALETLREAEKFGGWLYHITLKICLDHIRKRDRHDAPVRLDDLPHAGVASGESSPSTLETQEEQTKVSDAIAALPDKYRLVVTLRYIKKMSYKEIAEQLGEPDGTVANRIHRAVKMLQNAMGGLATPDEELQESES
jgi:RNA polymerase sigma-70 factor (ECF subfamily)